MSSRINHWCPSAEAQSKSKILIAEVHDLLQLWFAWLILLSRDTSRVAASLTPDDFYMSVGGIKARFSENAVKLCNCSGAKFAFLLV